MRAIVLLVVAGTACMSVRVAQRDGCWVKTTKRLGLTTEELGPCRSEPTKWADDRITRVVQECVARDERRWNARATAAWSRGEPVPEHADAASLRECIDESTRAALADQDRLAARLSEMQVERDALKGERDALAAKREAEVSARLDELKADRDALAKRTDAELTARIAEVSAQRDAVAARSDAERAHLFQSFDRIAGDLGDAVKKPNAPATATATATGTASGSGTGSGEGRTANDRLPVKKAAAPVCAQAATKQAAAKRGGPAAPRAAPDCAPANQGPAASAPGAGDETPERVETPAVRSDASQGAPQPAPARLEPRG